MNIPDNETSLFEDMEDIKVLADEILNDDYPEEVEADDYDYAVIEGEFANFYGRR